MQLECHASLPFSPEKHFHFFNLLLFLFLESANYAQKLLLFDALSGVFRIVKLRGRSKTCAINGDEPTIHALIDYEQFCRAGPNDKVCKNNNNPFHHSSGFFAMMFSWRCRPPPSMY